MYSPQIMIVEDERIVADDMQQMLEEYGYSIVSIENSGEGAVENAGLLKPDLILMDIMLKGKINGIQAAFNIGNQHDIPVIYLTAYGDNSTFRNALDTNPFGYLLKPFRKNDLKSMVEVALNKQQARRYKENIGKQTDRNSSSEKTYTAKTSSGVNSFFVHDTLTVNSHLTNYYGTTQVCSAPVLKESGPFSNLLDKYDTDLISLINELRGGEVSQKCINLLIKVSFKLASFKVKKNINRILNINKRWDLSVEDIAIDGISDLFVKNTKNNKLNLAYALLTWSEPVKDNLDALFFLNKAVSLSVEQRINRLLRETDPFFARMLDTFTKAVKKYNFSKIDHYGSVYVTNPGVSRINGNVIEYEEFLGIPVDLDQPKRYIISDLLDYLEDNTEYFPAIPLNPLVDRMLGGMQRSEMAPVSGSPSFFNKLSMKDIVDLCYTNTVYKLKKSYAETGKIGPEDFRIIVAVLDDISQDLAEGNTIWCLYDYVKKHSEDLTREEYKSVYQNTLEYLIKYFRQQIGRELKR
ncbi:MAG: response regulator [Ignavibacteriales bacterium]